MILLLGRVGRLMIGKDVNLVFVEGLFKLLNHYYLIDDISDIIVQYNRNSEDDFKDMRIEYLLKVLKADEDFASRLCRELNSLCKIGYMWLNGSYLAIYIDEDVSAKALRRRIHKYYDFKEPMSSIYISSYKSVVSQIENLIIDKQYCISYMSKKSGRVNKSVVYALSPNEAYDKFVKLFKDNKYVDFSSIEVHDNNFIDCIDEPEPKMVWSNSLDKQVIAGFTLETDETEEGMKQQN